MKKYLIGAAAGLAVLTPVTVYAANKIAAKNAAAQKQVKTEAKQTAKPAAKGKNFNCSDFSTWKEAQAVFEKNGGVNNDVYGLDRDKDGIACEDLKK